MALFMSRSDDNRNRGTSSIPENVFTRVRFAEAVRCRTTAFLWYYEHQAALHLQPKDHPHNDAIISPAHCTHACRTLRHESSYQFVRFSSTQLVMQPGLSNAAPWDWVDGHLRLHVDLRTTTLHGRTGPDSWMARLVIACLLAKSQHRLTQGSLILI